VIVMNGGTIEQIGSPEAIYNQPSSRFVADFVGSANMIPGRVLGPAQGGTLIFETEGGVKIEVLPVSSGQTGGSIVALRSAYIHFGHVSGSHNAVEGTIHRRMFHGDFIQYVVDWPGGQLIVRRPPTELLEEGSTVIVSFSPDHCVLL
jgi:iron(III) transport system ATP-binding protein